MRIEEGMGEDPDYQPTDEIIPILRLDHKILTWANSRIRLFNDETLNHIEYKDEEGSLVGLRVGRGILDLMFDLDFPMQFDPIPDSHTEEWFIKIEMKILSEELDNL